MHRRPRYNQKVNLTIQSLGINGEGVGYWHGYTMFVDGALPGEVIQARVSELNRKYGRGRLAVIESPSPARVEPPCPVFNQCGGCQIMHIDYVQQLALKRERVVQAFQRFARIEGIVVEPCIASPSPFAYRNKIQLPAAPSPSGMAIGLYARNSHELVEFDRCLIHCEKGEDVFQIVRDILKQSGVIAYDPKTQEGELRYLLIKTAINRGDVLVTFVSRGEASPALKKAALSIMERCPSVKGVVLNINSNEDNIVLSDTFHILAGSGSIQETLLGLTFKVSPASFFQVNTKQAEQLYRHAIGLADLTGTETVLDAYCGVGTLTLLAAQNSRHAAGIECVPEAIADAEENAAINKITNTSFHCGSVESLIDRYRSLRLRFSEPSQTKGCDPAVLACLAQRKPAKIVYISCDPATLARDAAILHSAGYSVGTLPTV